MTVSEQVDLRVGDEVEVEVGPIAHGGFCIARHEGRVVFVRHALPGERVRVRVTEARDGQRFVRADCVAVLTASEHRVTAPCPYAAPGLCGGCDFQHVQVAHQRDLKAMVVREQFSRVAKLEVEVVVEPVPGDHDGLGWRTRVEFAVDEVGRAGLRQRLAAEVDGQAIDLGWAEAGGHPVGVRRGRTCPICAALRVTSFIVA